MECRGRYLCIPSHLFVRKGVMKKKTKRRVSTGFTVLIFILGISLILYPTFSDYWNQLHMSRVISNYVDEVNSLNETDYESMMTSAQSYNQWLYESGHGLGLTDDEMDEYETELDVLGNGLMAYIEIPSIDVYLPVYHGTDESVLQIGAGHVEGSSLPIGGENTHSVISGHRGLPSARLFTDLDELETGDVFVIHVLNETLTYEIDTIQTVLPDEVDTLSIVEGEDLCTLVTCTPYGINDHRLLVTGHRTENIETEETEETDETEDNRINWIVVGGVSTGVLLVTVIVYKTHLRKKKRRRKHAA